MNQSLVASFDFAYMDVGKGREQDAEALIFFFDFWLVPALAGIPATTSDRQFPLSCSPNMTNLI